MSEAELTPVREAHRFDEESLHAYLSSHVVGYRGPLRVLQFEGGQSNPTFLLETPSGQYVMRKQPPGELLPSAHQVDREYRVMKALGDTAVPVPKMFAASQDADIIGTKFFVMEHIDGRLVTETLLPSFSREERSAVYLEMARTLAVLHSIDPGAVGLSDFGRPGNYFSRQVRRWTNQYIASETETIEAMDALIDWLPGNLPEEVRPIIVHGDYRLGNLILHPSEPRIIAILDWELSTLGDGLADLSYWCQEYYLDALVEEGLSNANLHSLGIPTEKEVINSYCEVAGRETIENWDFYIIYNMFRMAGIAQGVYKRGLDGNASSGNALEYADVARKCAECGWKLLQKASS